ncbi:hypothetical protein [Streptomyces sp. NPDC013457]|uniref:hypothetical protein n=1 Tax=Streptomyces sp. NPDC013457 TaxID=3364866 RepID=UPI003701BD66
MTFEYRDHDGDFVEVSVPVDLPFIAIRTGDRGCYIDPDRVEEVVAGIRDAARQAARQKLPTMAYGDGKGRVYCQSCAPTVGADVPLTVDQVDHWELCPSCGRPVVDVARQAAGQPAAAVPTLATPCDNCDHALNWHGNSAACIFAFCGCGRFRAPEDPAVGGQDATPPAESRVTVYGIDINEWDRIHEQLRRIEDAVTPLTAAERQFLTFALELASDQMANRGDEFEDEDHAALARLRRMADEATP